MKKIIISLVAMMAMTTAMAQDATTGATTQDKDKQEQTQERRQRMDPKQMVENRLKRMTERYKLTAEQQEKVRALIEKNMRNAAPGNRGQRGQRQEGAQGENQRPDFRKQMEEFNSELKAILTEEQYKAYQEDQQKMRQGRGQGGQRQNGPRQGRGQNGGQAQN